ncbi:hypothetical protein [Streptomyces kurssanovii]|uniref:Uncharacterized protein n=1 Tax=Streptomyces kurssanovii TaxID=67312 RepID=A0ABV3HX62_9ACTN
MNETGRRAAHLAAVWFVGGVLTAVQLQVVLIALFVDAATLRGGLLILAALLGLGALAGVASAARTIVPLAHRPSGRWIWTVSVHVSGTAGASVAAVVNFEIDHLENALPLYAVGGSCYALAAALFLPGTRIKLGSLGAAAVLVGGGAYAYLDAARPPTLDEHLAANGVDRGVLRVGDPPPGYTLRALGAGEDTFGAEYVRPDSVRLHLGVERAGHDPRRTDARGCPVPFGDPIHCVDDGEGRQLLTYEGGYERQELRLLRDGLVHTVTVEGHHADLPAARHVLSTLRPATEAELTGLLDLRQITPRSGASGHGTGSARPSSPS